MSRSVAARALAGVLPAARVREDAATLLVHESDGLTLFRERADVVAYPETTEEVAACVRAVRSQVNFLQM